ncbi:MAG: DNA-3-methyladenine glycosylase [Cyclobacteriaceae bacterium]
MKIEQGYYRQEIVQDVAKDLLGKVLYTRINNQVTAGVIVETEAYSWRERGCHAYNNLRTARTEVMFRTGGCAYVYLCYGIHNMFNVVTNIEGTAEAVLVRALEPIEGVQIMQRRTGAQSLPRITSGPGKLSKAMAIERNLNGAFLWGNEIWIEDSGTEIAKNAVRAVSRVGIDYAGEDATLPWRFIVADNPWISRS